MIVDYKDHVVRYTEGSKRVNGCVPDPLNILYRGVSGKVTKVHLDEFTENCNANHIIIKSSFKVNFLLLIVFNL